MQLAWKSLSRIKKLDWTAEKKLCLSSYLDLDVALCLPVLNGRMQLYCVKFDPTTHFFSSSKHTVHRHLYILARTHKEHLVSMY